VEQVPAHQPSSGEEARRVTSAAAAGRLPVPTSHEQSASQPGSLSAAEAVKPCRPAI